MPAILPICPGILLRLLGISAFKVPVGHTTNIKDVRYHCALFVVIVYASFGCLAKAARSAAEDHNTLFT